MHLLYCRMAVDTDYCKSLIVSHNNTPSLFSSVHCGILEEYDHPYNEESIQIKYIFRFSNNTRRIKALLKCEPLSECIYYPPATCPSSLLQNGSILCTVYYHIFIQATSLCYLFACCRLSVFSLVFPHQWMRLD